MNPNIDSCRTFESCLLRRLSFFSIVEITLKYLIKLWEQRNEEEHGKTTEQQETTRETKLSIDARKLNSLKDKA
jgi:hypothetical protein